MNVDLEAVEERIKRLECILFGQTGNVYNNEEQLVDTLLTVSRKLANHISKNEKVGSALKRADEIGKYTDPMYMDSENFMPDSVKFQVVAAKEKELKNSLELFQKLNTIKPVLDSHAIQGTSQLEGQLHSIVFNQGVQERKVTSMTEETYSLLKDYSELVNGCSEKLAEIEKQIRGKGV